MPDWPRLSGAEIVEALERLGYRRLRQRGSHVVMRKGTSGCAVPQHRVVKGGNVGGFGSTGGT